MGSLSDPVLLKSHVHTAFLCCVCVTAAPESSEGQLSALPAISPRPPQLRGRDWTEFSLRSGGSEGNGGFTRRAAPVVPVRGSPVLRGGCGRKGVQGPDLPEDGVPSWFCAQVTGEPTSARSVSLRGAPHPITPEGKATCLRGEAGALWVLVAR